MEQYSSFAEIYDFLMDNKDYELWTENIEKIYRRYKFMPKKILELGCGTGSITIKMYKKGYSIIGTDISEEMLEIANNKAEEENLRIRFILQDMTNLTYNKKVDSVISICDGINYIVRLEDLKKTIDGISNILEDDGMLIFDVSTIYKLENIIGNNVFHENFKNFSYVWDNEYNNETKILQFELTMFLLTDNNKYERFIENHIQKAHSVAEISELLKKDYKILGILSEKNLKEIKNNDERIYFVAKRKRRNDGK
jgi:ubiquinone/menaquinone biosynthesis C-methylase UbiE